MTNDKWKVITKVQPPQGVVVLTKIYNEGVSWNEQELVRKGSLWFFPDMSRYVYYPPTHFKETGHDIRNAP